jgi:site-specific recombinase XerD
MTRRGELPGQDLLFVNQWGNRLCRYWIEKAIRTLGRSVGIQGVRVSPHTLRHYADFRIMPSHQVCPSGVSHFNSA